MGTLSLSYLYLYIHHSLLIFFIHILIFTQPLIYTQYTDYHHWNQQSQIAQNSLSKLPPSHPATLSNNVQRDEMERREKWATYYAGKTIMLLDL